MQKLLARLWGSLKTLAAITFVATVNTVVMDRMGWSSVDDFGGYVPTIAFTTAVMALFFFAIHYGERLWRWLGLDAP